MRTGARLISTYLGFSPLAEGVDSSAAFCSDLGFASAFAVSFVWAFLKAGSAVGAQERQS